MDITNTSNLILKIVLKDLSAKHTVTSLSKEVSMSRQGTFKALKKLDDERLILLSQISTGKTSANIISLNWKNKALEKRLSLILTEEAVRNERWANEFADLEDKTGFTLIYGSILKNPKEANDIDLLNLVLDKKKFTEIEKTISSLQKIQVKKIHAISLTETELKEELKRKNKAFIDAIKKGVVLFGQDIFVKFIAEVN